MWATDLVGIELEPLDLMAKPNPLPHRRSMVLPVRFIRPPGIPATLADIYRATDEFPAVDRLPVGLAWAIRLPVMELSLLAPIMEPILKLVLPRTPWVLLRACPEILGTETDRGLVENYIRIPEFPVIPALVPGSTCAYAFLGLAELALCPLITANFVVPSPVLTLLPDADVAYLGTVISLLADARDLPTVNVMLIMTVTIVTNVIIMLTMTCPCPPVPVVVVCRLVCDPMPVVPALPAGETRLNRLAIGPNVRAGRRGRFRVVAGRLCLVLSWVPTPERLARGPNVVVIGMLLPTQAKILPPNLEVAVQWPR